MPPPLGEVAQKRNPVLSDLCRRHRAKPVPQEPDRLVAMSITRSAKKSSTFRSDSGYCTYIITTGWITSGELLKYPNGLRMAQSYQVRGGPKNCSDTTLRTRLRSISTDVNLAFREVPKLSLV
jgi:hypothetical protein